jgi:hypothetical protein
MTFCHLKKYFQVVLGHSLDAAPELVNQSYIVCAHILEVTPRGRWAVAEEKFTALCLPGMLPGFYMAYNHHGFAFCVNAVSTGVSSSDTFTRKEKLTLLGTVFIEITQPLLCIFSATLSV